MEAASSSSAPKPSSPMASATISEVRVDPRQNPDRIVCPILQKLGKCYIETCELHHPPNLELVKRKPIALELPMVKPQRPDQPACPDHLPMEEPKKPKRGQKRRRTSKYPDFTREELQAYMKRLNDTEGFDIGYFPPCNVVLSGMTFPLPLNECGREIKKYAKLAIEDYNEKLSTEHKFFKLIRVNVNSNAGGSRYYITFQAKDEKPGSRPKSFQTRVSVTIGKTEVQFCRLEEKISPEVPGETSQQQQTKLLKLLSIFRF